MIKNIILFIFALSVTCAAQNGVAVRISQETINKALEAGTPLMVEMTKRLKMDDFHQDFPVGSADFSNIKVLELEFKKPLRVVTESNLFCVKSDEVTSKVSIQVFAKLMFSATFVVVADLSIVDFLVCLSVTLDQQHKFVARVARSKIEVNEFKTELKTVEGETFNKLTAIVDMLGGFIRSSINNFLATGLPKNMEENMAKMIDKNKPIAFLEKTRGVLMDLTAVHPPLFSDGILYSSKGYVFQEQDWAKSYEFAQPPEKLPEMIEGYGISVHLHEFVIKNAIALMWEYTDLFTRVFTEKSDIVPMDFTVEGFSKVFQKLDTKYPKDLPTKVVARVVQPPNVKIYDGYISVFVRMEAQVFVIQDGKEINFCQLAMVAQVDAVASFENVSILKILPRSSTIIDVDYFNLYGVEVNRDLINQTINGAVQLFINYFGFDYKERLDLIVDLVTFKKTSLRMTPEVLILGADVDFKPINVQEFLSPKKSPKKVDSPQKSPVKSKTPSPLRQVTVPHDMLLPDDQNNDDPNAQSKKIPPIPKLKAPFGVPFTSAMFAHRWAENMRKKQEENQPKPVVILNQKI